MVHAQVNEDKFSMLGHDGCLDMRLVGNHLHKLSNEDKTLFKELEKLEKAALAAASGYPLRQALENLATKAKEVEGCRRFRFSVTGEGVFEKRAMNEIKSKFATPNIRKKFFCFRTGKNASDRRKRHHKRYRKH